MYDVIIRNGTVVDGDGAPGYLADVAIQDGLIAAVGDIQGAARQEIDATGRVVAPGFIDPHTHFDAQLLWDGHARPALEHGVTCVVPGNCSLSLAPLRVADRAAVVGMFQQIEEMPAEAFTEKFAKWTWEDFAGYCRTITPDLGINVAPLVGHSLIRLWVMGPASQERPATPDEVSAMQDLLRECLAANAIGLSTSFIDVDANGRPVPSRFADYAELDALCAVLGEAGGRILQVVPEFYDADLTIARIDQLAELSLKHGIPTTFSPVFDSKLTPKAAPRILARVEEQFARGARVWPQMQTRPIDISFSMLNPSLFLARLPSWFRTLRQPLDKRLEALADPATVKQMIADAGPDGGSAIFSNLVVRGGDRAPAAYVGRRLGDIAAERGEGAAEAVINMSLENGLDVAFLAANGGSLAAPFFLRIAVGGLAGATRLNQDQRTTNYVLITRYNLLTRGDLCPEPPGCNAVLENSGSRERTMRIPRDTRRRALACSAGTILLAAAAASAPSGAWAQARDGVSVTEVVVTASKRAENLQDVASSVTAFTSEMRDTTGIISAQQQLNFTPGVTYNPGVDRITVRGIGRLTQQLGTDPGVSVYDDGFYAGSVAGLSGSTLRVERVEVLRGPQGTLYGRNSVGGAVNTISKRPSTTFGGEARGSIDSYGRLVGEARVTGPLSDAFSAALSFNYFDQNEGYYKNTAGGPDEGGVGHGWSFDAQLAFQPNERFDAWLRFTANDSFTRPRNETGITDYGINVRGEGIPYVFYGLQSGTSPGVTDHRKFRTDQPRRTTLDNSYQVIGEMVYHADAFDVKYSTGYRTFETNIVVDGNAVDNKDISFPFDCLTLITPPGTVTRATPLDAIEDCDIATPGVQRQFRNIHNDTLLSFPGTDEEFSHELNISSTGDGPLQYILGLYYYRAKQNAGLHFDSLNEPGNNIITIAGTSAPNESPDSSNLYRYDTTLKTTSKAIYGQIDYQFSPQLKFTLGLRGSEDTKKGYEDNVFNAWLVTGFPAGAFGPGSPFTPFEIVVGTCVPGPQVAEVPPFVRVFPQFECPIRRNLKKSYKALTGTLGLEWTPNDDRLIYGKYSRGFKSGGYNLGSALANPFVGSEYVDAFEGGWKENFGRFQINSAAFYYRYKGLQALNARIQGTILLNELINLPRVENYGLELETTWRPTDRLTILANYGYLHSQIKKGCCYSDGADPAALQPGAKPVGTPIIGAVENTQGQSLVGNQPAGSPKHKGAVNASYVWDFAGGSLIASGTFNYTGKSYQTLFNNPLHRVKGGDSTDLRLTWAHPDSGVTIIGSVTNVFDQEVVNGFVTLPPQNLSFQSLYLEPPRIWSLEVRYAF
ncbi:TonB-dependent receptor [uncultured Phenylobacterium sp.]|uniref:TonB-dependent receptor domain-containing protein n=1 Tax=uncultured Phenylobacterium sp. TaxID=349273 RepID=UPI0025F64305|nr:TonB-dependent receptor [uncultured Phenylobacterium sp.]